MAPRARLRSCSVCRADSGPAGPRGARNGQQRCSSLYYHPRGAGKCSAFTLGSCTLGLDLAPPSVNSDQRQNRGLQTMLPQSATPKPTFAKQQLRPASLHACVLPPRGSCRAVACTLGVTCHGLPIFMPRSVSTLNRFSPCPALILSARSRNPEPSTLPGWPAPALGGQAPLHPSGRGGWVSQSRSIVTVNLNSPMRPRVDLLCSMNENGSTAL